MPDVHLGALHTGSVVFPGGSSKQGPHRLGAAATCLQLEAFGYELNLRPNVEKDATKIGTLVHVGLAYRYGALLDKKPDWLVYPDARWAIWICGQDRPDCASEALRIYDAYVAHYDPLLALGRRRAVEAAAGRAPVRGHLHDAQRLDGALHDAHRSARAVRERDLASRPQMRCEDLEPQRQALRGRSADADAARRSRARPAIR